MKYKVTVKLGTETKDDIEVEDIKKAFLMANKAIGAWIENKALALAVFGLSDPMPKLEITLEEMKDDPITEGSGGADREGGEAPEGL